MMRREWLVRALRTFVQAALGYAAAHAAGLIGDGEGLTKNALAALAVASIAAGLAALMNANWGGKATKVSADDSAYDDFFIALANGSDCPDGDTFPSAPADEADDADGDEPPFASGDSREDADE